MARGQEDLFQNITHEIKDKGEGKREGSQAEVDIENNDRQVIVFMYTFCDLMYICK